MAVRIPDRLAKAAGIRDGDRVEIEARDQDIVIRGAAPRFTLEELFRGMTANEWRAQYAGAFDWGPDVGRQAARVRTEAP